MQAETTDREWLCCCSLPGNFHFRVQLMSHGIQFTQVMMWKPTAKIALMSKRHMSPNLQTEVVTDVSVLTHK